MPAHLRLSDEALDDKSERAEAPQPAPDVARLLALQRSAGNAVVARAVLARKKFASQDAALEWLDDKPGQKDGQTEDEWLGALLDADKDGYALAKDRAMNLRTLKAARAKAAKGVKQQAKSVREAKPKGPKRDVPDAVMTHVVEGVVKDGKPTGFHSVKGTRPVMEKTGDPLPKGDDGCYWSAVRSIKDQTAKPKGSTFYPDDWTRDQ